jgi:E3 ubiquitin-protein ligase HERC1
VATDVLYKSPAGSMLSYVIHSLLTLPVHAVRPLLHELLSLLPHLDRLNCIFIDPSVLEEEEHSMPGKNEFVCIHLISLI